MVQGGRRKAALLNRTTRFFQPEINGAEEISTSLFVGVLVNGVFSAILFCPLSHPIVALSNAESNAENIAVPDDVIFSFQPEVAVLAHPLF